MKPIVTVQALILTASILLGSLIPAVAQAAAPQALAPPPSTALPGVALLIGIKGYRRDWRPLPYAGNDLARMIGALAVVGVADSNMFVVTDVPLRDLEHAAGRPLRDVNLVPLPISGDGSDTPVEPGRYISLILQSLKAACRERPASTLVVYYSGHGVTLDQDVRQMVMPTSLSDDSDTMLSVNRLNTKLAELRPTGHKVVIIDACARSAEGHASTTDGIAHERYHISMLFAADLGQVSYFHKNLSGSVYTHFLTEAVLQPGGGANERTTSDIAKYAKRQVRAYVEKWRSELIPTKQLKDNEEWHQVPCQLLHDEVTVRYWQ